ncbi:MAG: hypothetical protein GKR93_14215 [Gammaproteobacteria bacterium]|nr:hypothetical protein [Gammaproteobacteria bacterium]
MLRILWQSFFAICCFEKKPQDLPASKELWFVTLLSYLTSSIILTLTTQAVETSLISGILDTTILATLTLATLRFKGVSERWLQVTSALYGTGFLFGIAAIPLSYLLSTLPQESPVVFLVFLFVISLMLWNIGVMAHILKHALSSTMLLGVMLALSYVCVITMIVTSLFPEIAPQ